MSEAAADRTTQTLPSGEASPIGQASPSGEEELRFIRNFHDVFLSIGLGLFIVGIGVASSMIVGEKFLAMLGTSFSGVPRALATTAAIVAFVDAAIVWALGEVFARTRRLFLPAIVILIGFVFFVVVGTGWAYAATVGIEDYERISLKIRMLLFLLAVSATMATFAYYARMKLPFAMGLGGAALAGTVVTGLAIFIPSILTDHVLKVIMLEGLFLFLLGVYYDARDPERRTRLSDNGFWLHFFAAPLIFLSVTRMAAGGEGLDAFATGGAASAPIATLLIVFVFAFVSLMINRRALLVSGLLSAIIAVSVLMNKTALNSGWTAAATLLILGGAMVALGGGWHSLRAVLVSPFPKSGLIARIIPPETGPNPRDQLVG